MAILSTRGVYFAVRCDVMVIYQEYFTFSKSWSLGQSYLFQHDSTSEGLFGKRCHLTIATGQTEKGINTG